jgi:hypothetical protein
MTNAVSIAQSGSSNQTFRNWIVNGGFDVWQRGTPVTGVNTWTADRFFNTNAGMTWTRANNTLGGPCPYMCTLTGGDSSSRFRFSFELPSSTNQAPFTVGSYWTLSLYTDFNLTGRTMNVGFADQPNGTTDICSNDATWVSLGGNRWSLTVQINATNSNNRLAMRFSGPFNGPGNHGLASISITGVQFEAGTTATNFEQRPIGVEVALCQRYYFQQGGGVYTRFGGAIALARSTTQATSVPFFPVAMRTFPTVGAVNLGNTTINSTAVSSISLDSYESTPNFPVGPARLNVFVSGGLTSGVGYEWESNNNNTTRITFSAEL